jgi:hypothetical protein
VTHGTVSLAAGFLTGLALFVLLGATTEDAVFSALALALVVAASRGLGTWP